MQVCVRLFFWLASLALVGATSREDSLVNVTRFDPANDSFPLELSAAFTDEYESLAVLGAPITTAGVESSPFVTPNGNTLYFFFTPNASVPAVEQVSDGVTGVWRSDRDGEGKWREPERVWIFNPSEPGLDGSVFVLDSEVWLPSVRTVGLHMFKANSSDCGRTWNTPTIATELEDYGVEDLHIVNTDSGLVMYCGIKVNGTSCLHKSLHTGAGWTTPIRLPFSTGDANMSLPFVNPANLTELWFTSASVRSPGTHALWRTRQTADDEWTEPVELLANFSGEITADKFGNFYFTHHYVEDGEIMGADVFQFRAKGVAALPTREEALAHETEFARENDSYPVHLNPLFDEVYEQPSVVAPLLGVEDSPFVSPDGQTLFIFFTPNATVPVETQALDKVTGIWRTQKSPQGYWQGLERVWLFDPEQPGLDGCAFVLEDTMWFRSARGAEGMQWYIADRCGDTWTNTRLAPAEIHEYGVSELHIVQDGDDLVMYCGIPDNGKEYLHELHYNGTAWEPPIPLPFSNAGRLPFINPANKRELWFTSASELNPGTNALWRTHKAVDGLWSDPVEIVSNFAGEVTGDIHGNFYFTHHYVQDGQIVTADIFQFKAKPTREEVLAGIPKFDPADDLYPLELSAAFLEDYEDLTVLPAPVNTAGAEDSPFVTPDGDTLFFFFTPNASISPVAQSTDKLTGVWKSEKDASGTWSEVKRVWLFEYELAGLDGCEFVLNNTMWFCSIRTADKPQWYIADLSGDTWTNTRLAPAEIHEYGVSELHIVQDGDDLVMYCGIHVEGTDNGTEYLHELHYNGTAWEPPIRMPFWKPKPNVDMRLPFINPANKRELWFTSPSEVRPGTGALWRTRKSDNGTWSPPVEMVSNFAGEVTGDIHGNFYFVHHYINDGKIVEADIYHFHVKRVAPPRTREEVLANTTKFDPATDSFPLQLSASFDDDYDAISAVRGPINTAGAEDSPFVTPDGNTLYFFFTPNASTAKTEQTVDGMTGIWRSDKDAQGNWMEPQRVWLFDPTLPGLDGCEFILDNTMWFCSFRTDSGSKWYLADADGQTWTNTRLAPPELENHKVSELHIAEIDSELVMFCGIHVEGTDKGTEYLHVLYHNGTAWGVPIRLSFWKPNVDMRLPFINPANKRELWFTSPSEVRPGTGALWRTRKSDNGTWSPPIEMVSNFAGEVTGDIHGNFYFVHHYINDGKIVEADIYHFQVKKKTDVPIVGFIILGVLLALVIALVVVGFCKIRGRKPKEGEDADEMDEYSPEQQVEMDEYRPEQVEMEYTTSDQGQTGLVYRTPGQL